MSDKTYSYLLLFGLITISAASSFNCSVAVPTTITCTCSDTMEEIKCISTEVDNNTVISTVNTILMSSTTPVISEVHIESPKLQINAGILFPNSTIKTLAIIKSDLTDLPELALSNLKELQNLTLASNSFTNIPGRGLLHLSALEFLILSHNKIQHVNVGDLTNLSALIYLSLTYNVINFIDDDSFSSLIKLNSLYMKNNMLPSLQKGIFKGVINLRTLDVSANKLLNLPKDLFTHLTCLKTFIADDNNFASLKNIEIVSLSLTKLSLENSTINGPLESGILEGLQNLTELFLSKNPIGNISSYAFAQMQKLIKLKLDSCELVTLDKTAFHNLTRLSSLDLSGNRLQELTCLHTLYLESLEEIDLANNELKTIERGTFNYSLSLNSIDLEGNKLLCDCELASFAELLEIRSLNPEEIECSDGISLNEVKFDEMNCVDNDDICTKVKEVTNLPKEANLTTSNPQFTIKFEQITQQSDSLAVTYSTNRIGNFSVEGFSCYIAYKHLSENEFENISLRCELDKEQTKFTDITVSDGEGTYNVCISIFNDNKMFSVECTTVEYIPPDTTTEGQNAYSLSEIVETTTHATTILSAIPDIPSSRTTSTRSTSTTAYNASVITSMLKISTMIPTTDDQTTDSPMLKISTTIPTTDDRTADSSVLKKSTVIPTTDDRTANSSVLKISTMMPTTKDQTTDVSVITTVSLPLTYLPSISAKTSTSATFPFTDEQYTTASSLKITNLASSKSTAKLSVAAFIVLIILAVIILILIIIVLIKLVYLRRNKTNTYYVAKEEVDNQNIKRRSNLYSVSSVEDDQV